MNTNEDTPSQANWQAESLPNHTEILHRHSPLYFHETASARSASASFNHLAFPAAPTSLSPKPLPLQPLAAPQGLCKTLPTAPPPAAPHSPSPLLLPAAPPCTYPQKPLSPQPLPSPSPPAPGSPPSPSLSAVPPCTFLQSLSFCSPSLQTLPTAPHPAAQGSLPQARPAQALPIAPPGSHSQGSMLPVMLTFPSSPLEFPCMKTTFPPMECQAASDRMEDKVSLLPTDTHCQETAVHPPSDPSQTVPPFHY